MKIAAMILALLILGADGDQQEVTLKGEIVDMHCYLSRHGEGRGVAHAGCANSCISRGVTPGFISEEGKLYVLLNEKMIPVKDKIAGLAGQTVSLTGLIIERDGVRAINLLHAEPVK
jgi:hypothetical protein